MKYALVTGGSRGIGRAVCARFIGSLVVGLQRLYSSPTP